MTDAEMTDAELADVKRAVDEAAYACHTAARESGWWTNLQTGEDMRVYGTEKPKFNVPEKLMLIVSELAEAMEGHRTGRQDDKLPQYPMLWVELADALIRTCDTAGGLNIPLGEVVAAKLAFNAQRADHKIEARKAAGGKAY